MMKRRELLRGAGLRCGAFTAFAVLLALMPARAPVAGEAEAITLKVGTAHEYALEGTPGTGAQWQFAEDQSEGAWRVEVEDLGYGEPTGEVIGGAAPYRFRLEALEAGSARLVFVYKRSWETEVWREHVLRLTIR